MSGEQWIRVAEPIGPVRLALLLDGTVEPGVDDLLPLLAEVRRLQDALGAEIALRLSLLGIKAERDQALRHNTDLISRNKRLAMTLEACKTSRTVLKRKVKK